MSLTRLIIFLASILSGVLASAQGLYKTYGPNTSNAQDLLETSNGNYFMAGFIEADSSLFVQRVDAIGDVIWTNHLNLNHAKAIAVSQSTDGGFGVLAEYFADTTGFKNILLKLNGDGTFSWSTVLHNHLLPNGLRDMVSTNDGGFLLAGDTRDSLLNSKNWLVKIATDGSIAWKKTYGTFHYTNRIVALSNGNYAISGGKNGGTLSLAVVNPTGDLQWQQSYIKPNYQKAYDLIAGPNASVTLMGTTQNSSLSRLEICLLKLDDNGNELFFTTVYPFPWDGEDQSLMILGGFAQDTAGNYYIPISSDPAYLEILKLDASGNAVWKKETIANQVCTAIIPTMDNHFALTGGTNAFLLKLDSDAEIFSNKISGTVFRDQDLDCLMGTTETGLSNFIVELHEQSGQIFFKKTNSDGSYDIRVPEGSYKLLAKPIYGPPALYDVCDTLEITVVGLYQVFQNQHIGVAVFAECPMLDVEIGNGLLRRCVNNQYTVSWCNYGNLAAENAYIEVLADTLLLYSNSSIPLSSQNGNVFTFNIPDVAPGDCGSFTIDFLVRCIATIGDVICVEAHSFPDSSCLPPGVNWDGSNIEVSGECLNDVLSFKIKNKGSGNMTEAMDYVIIEDHIMYMQGSVQLDAGADSVIIIPAPDGACYLGKVLDAGNGVSTISHPTAVVENCISGGTLALALQFETGENNYAISTTCGDVVGSYDPNDKRGFPLGWTDQHLLERNTDIEYIIRFQNTGNDTAFLVVIRDTLPLATLDPSSLRPVAASHDYTWDVTGNGVATFTFTNILLPDSTTNEPESNGFIRFRIRQQPDLPDGVIIENRAAIFFDFNDPVITDPYFYTIGRPIILVTKSPGARLLNFKVFPNPFQGEATFELQDYVPKGAVQFRLFDAMGNQVQSEFFTGNRFHFVNNTIPSGFYFFHMEMGGQLLTSGKVIVSK